MSATPIYCAACGLQNSREASFCSSCGSRLVLPPDSEHPVTSLGRDIIEETRKEVRDRVIVQPIAEALAAKLTGVLGTIGTILNSVRLWMLDTSRSIPGWFLLTWPLTLASAVIVLLARRSLKGSIAIVPAGAIIVIGAAWLGSILSSAVYYVPPSPYSEQPGGSFMSIALGMLMRMYELYGADAFVTSVVTGVIVGVIVDRVVPEGITQVS